ncbi:MAG: lipopolysaccharide biosynthesis protein [Sarcina sp.]
MRAKNSLKNAKINLIFTLVTTILGFISRTIFIDYLGSTLLGFNTLIVGVIGVLNVAELGIGVAVSYELYKPLVDENYEKINEIMVIFKRIYSYIGIAILVMGLIFLPFLKGLIKNEIPYNQAVIYFLILLIGTAGTYFFSYKQVLINADQKSYIVQEALGISNIIKSLFQIFVMVVFRSYLAWLIIFLVFSLGGNIYASYKTQKYYGDKISFKSKEKTTVIMRRNVSLKKNIFNIFFHKLGEIVIFQTDPIVISAFATLKETAIYANYTMVITALTTILGTIFNAMTASVGNLIASESNERAYEVFKEIRFMINTIGIIICFSLFMTVDKFISIWVGQQYLFSTPIVLIIIFNLYVQLTRNAIGTYKGCYGIYWDIWAPVIEGLINLVLSIGLSYKFGIIGVFIGTLASNIAIILIWQPYTVYKYGFKKNPLKYYLWFIGTTILYGAISIGLYELINKIDSLIFVSNGIINFLFTGFISVIFMSLIIFILNFRNPSLRKLILRVKSIILKRI